MKASPSVTRNACAFATLALVVASGCSAGAGGASSDGPSGGPDDGSGGSGAGVGAGAGTGMGSGGTDLLGDLGGGDPGTGGTGNVANGGDDACEAVVQRAERRIGGLADVIFVLDNSGSMTEEAFAVQNNMNTFSQRIVASGVDARVVVIASGPPSVDPAAQCANLLDPACWAALGNSFSGDNGVCIEPPLGTPGACPDGDDTNLAAGYMHWRETVGSHDALAKIQSTFSGWQQMLRAEASKTFVVVTDDEAAASPSAAEFSAWVDSQPLFASALWRFSGIFCVTNGSNCANPGVTYSALVNQTGGISGDLALFASGQVDAEFSRVFDSLADQVVADAVPVDCEWAIPAAPEGEELDPNNVNVRFTNSAGQPQMLFGVDDPGQCPAATDYLAWHYDDPSRPTRVIACTDTCTTLQADDNAQIEVLFGCARETVPIR